MSEKTVKRGGMLQTYIKAMLLTTALTITAALLCAIFIKVFGWTDDIIAPITQIIKIAGIITAVFCITLGKNAKNGWLHGLSAGTLYIVTGFIIFGAINGSLPGGVSILSDIGLGAIAGALSGIIGVNIKKKKR